MKDWYWLALGAVGVFMVARATAPRDGGGFNIADAFTREVEVLERGPVFNETWVRVRVGRKCFAVKNSFWEALITIDGITPADLIQALEDSAQQAMSLDCGTTLAMIENTVDFW